MSKFAEPDIFDKKSCRKYSRLAQSLMIIAVLCLYHRFPPITVRLRYLTSSEIIDESHMCPFCKNNLRLQAESSVFRPDSQRSWSGFGEFGNPTAHPSKARLFLTFIELSKTGWWQSWWRIAIDDRKLATHDPCPRLYLDHRA